MKRAEGRVAFVSLSYRAQVRRLRTLAQVALQSYRLRVVHLQFINYGENATFRVFTAAGPTFLLRIHRDDYHSESAVRAELKWLVQLSKMSSFAVPCPLRTRGGDLLTRVKSSDFPKGRLVCLFSWIEGRFIAKSLSLRHFSVLGEFIGQLHRSGSPEVARRRRYWDADGLVGRLPKFGSLDHLPGVKPSDQRQLTQARQKIWRRLRAFEKRWPEKCGAIHADLHFGNVFWSKGGVVAIDFDDCGWGFHAYDLVAPLVSAEHIFGQKRKREITSMRSALIDGYRKYRSWTSKDDLVLDDLIMARRLTMLGWLQSRSDNPRLRKLLPGAVKKVLLRLKRAAVVIAATGLSFGGVACGIPLETGGQTIDSGECADSPLNYSWSRTDGQEVVVFSSSCAWTSTACRATAVVTPATGIEGTVQINDMVIGDSSCQRDQPDRTCTYLIDRRNLTLTCKPSGGGTYTR